MAVSDKSSNRALPPPPIFGVACGGDEKKNGIISLDDIFDEFLFSSDRQQSRLDIYSEARNGSSSAGFKDDDDCEDYDEDDDDDDCFDEDADGKKRKRSRGLQRNMTEEQKVERR